MIFDDTVAETHVWISGLSLSNGDLIRARQDIGPTTSPWDSENVVSYEDEHGPVPAPVVSSVSLPLRECGRALMLTGLIPHATVEVLRVVGGNATVVGSMELNASDGTGETTFAVFEFDEADAFELGESYVARQILCGPTPSAESNREDVFASNLPLPQPEIVFFREDPSGGADITVDGLVFGAVIDITIDSTVQPQLSLVVGAEAVGFNLPVSADLEKVEISQRLCPGSDSPLTPSQKADPLPVSNPCDLPTPRIQPPSIGDVFVHVIGAAVDGRIQVFANIVEEIGDGGGNIVLLRRPIRAGDKLTILQTTPACGQNDFVWDVPVECRPYVEADHPFYPPGQQPAYVVGSAEYDDGAVNLYGRSVPIRGLVKFPAMETDAGTIIYPESKQYPVVVIMSGRHGIWQDSETGDHMCSEQSGMSRIYSHLGYQETMDRLAQHGIMSIAIDIDEVNCPGGSFETDASTDLHRRQGLLDETMVRLGSATSDLHGRLGGRHGDVFFLGHSRGGTTVTRVAPGWGVAGVIALAPADGVTTDPMSPLFRYAGSLTDIPLLVILPSADGDLERRDGARIFDRAKGDQFNWFKAQFYVRGAIHNFYNTEWASEWLPSQITPPGQHTREQHTNSLARWTHVFVDYVERQSSRPVLAGDQFLRGVDINSSVDVSYQNYRALIVDDVEDGNGPTSSSSGGVVTAGQGVLDEVSLANGGVSSYAGDTTGVQISPIHSFGRWSDGSGWNTTANSWSDVSVRIGRRLPGGAYPLDKVSLVVEIPGKSAQVNLASIGSNSLGTYNHPHDALNVLQTLRVPLRCAVGEEGPLTEAELSSVQAIRLLMLSGSDTLEMDDLLFTD